MRNQILTMPSEIKQISDPCLVRFETIELVATMWALVQFVNHSHKFSEFANQQYVDIAEALIIRFQDILDEDQIRGLSSRAA